MSDVTRAEFEVKDKVHYWNGKEFKVGAVMGVKFNPIDNIVEYKLFFRNKDSGKRGRESVLATPYKIRESEHFIRPTKPKQTGLEGTKL